MNTTLLNSIQKFIALEGLFPGTIEAITIYKDTIVVEYDAEYQHNISMDEYQAYLFETTNETNYRETMKIFANLLKNVIN